MTTPIQFPSLISCCPDGIPDELRLSRQWVVWRNDPPRKPGDKPIKVLYNPHTGGQARTHDADGKSYENTASDTWGSFDDAVEAFKSNAWNGIGFVFTQSDPYIGGDIDGCRNPDTGAITEEAHQLIRLANTYTEISQSGTGVKFIGRGSKIGTKCKKGGVEMYETARYFALTGQHLEGTPVTLEDSQEGFAELYRRWFPEHERPKPIEYDRAIIHSNGRLSDADILEKLERAANASTFQEYFGGSFGGKPSKSEAVQALLWQFCFYTNSNYGGGASQIESLFRQSALCTTDYDRPHGGEPSKAAYEAARANTSYTGAVYSPMQSATNRAASSHKKNATVPGSTNEPVSPEAVALAEKALNEELTHYPMTDMGLGERLVRRHGGELRYCHQWGKWLTWDGRRWKPDETNEIARRAKLTIRQIYAEAAAVSPDDTTNRASDLVAFAKKSEARDRLMAMIAMAQSELEVSVTSDTLDADPWLLNCANGTLDLQTGELSPHTPIHLLTKCLPVDLDPSAAAPQWEKFLERVLPDPQVRAYVQRAVGYALTGVTSEQCLFFLFGSGSNGKSIFAGTLEALLNDYWDKTRAETLMQQKNGGGIPNDVAALAGLRLVTVSEVNDGQKLNEALVKDMTGGDRMSARFMRAEFFTFQPVFKLWLYGNHKPQIKGTDDGIWRRMRLIPFTVTIPDDEKDRHLLEKLKQELKGVLAWAVRGCMEWQRIGLCEPSEIIEATNGYRNEMDALSDFLTEYCAFDPQGTVAKKALFDVYEQYCRDIGEQGYDKQTPFNKEIGKRPGIRPLRGTGGIGRWQGLCLRTRSSDSSDCSDSEISISELGSPRGGVIVKNESLESLQSLSYAVVKDEGIEQFTEEGEVVRI